MQYYRQVSLERGGGVNYLCKLCEKEGRVVIITTEIKIVKHIQREHPHLNLVVNLCSGGLANSKEKLQETLIADSSQGEIFLPCDTGIYLYNNIIVKFQKSTNENNQLYVSQSICQL